MADTNECVALEMILSAISRIRRSNVSIDDEAFFDIPLTGNPFYLNSIDLLYLLLLLEDASGKTLNRTAIYRGEFSTPRQIIRLLCSSFS